MKAYIWWKNKNLIKNSRQILFDWLRAFLYISWERDFPKTCSFCRIKKTTMLHHVNQKIAQQWSKSFANSKSPTFKDISGFLPKIRFFPGCITFLSLRNQKFVWNSIIQSVVFEKKWFWLTDWLADSGLMKGTIINLINRHEQCCISLFIMTLPF